PKDLQRLRPELPGRRLRELTPDPALGSIPRGGPGAIAQGSSRVAFPELAFAPAAGRFTVSAPSHPSKEAGTVSRRLFTAAALALTVALAASVSAQPPEPASAAPSPFAAAWQVLERQVAPLRPSAGDLRYQQIPWVGDPAEALRLARSERRP